MPDQFTYTRTFGPFQNTLFIDDLKDEFYYAERKLEGDRKHYAKMVTDFGVTSKQAYIAAKTLASAEVWAEYAKTLLKDVGMEGPLEDSLRYNMKRQRNALSHELHGEYGSIEKARAYWSVIRQLEAFITFIEKHGEEKKQ
jgi:hypothetical protein